MQMYFCYFFCNLKSQNAGVSLCKCNSRVASFVLSTLFVCTDNTPTKTLHIQINWNSILRQEIFRIPLRTKQNSIDLSNAGVVKKIKSKFDSHYGAKLIGSKVVNVVMHMRCVSLSLFWQTENGNHCNTICDTQINQCYLQWSKW